ncbi:MAG: hypothetical protein UU71_C0015G0006 [Parcubacteria group bacterium GW2011_GWB1_41_6]|nr:MAG: hypothetical protein UU71_C0015G0006 [Parcubacteria group bacterium GW2011_GWB1_41_6]
MAKITLEFEGSRESEEGIRDVALAAYMAHFLNIDSGMAIEVIKVVTNRDHFLDFKRHRKFHIVYKFPYIPNSEEKVIVSWVNSSRLASVHTDDGGARGGGCLGEIKLDNERPESIAKGLVKAIIMSLKANLSHLQIQARLIEQAENKLRYAIREERSIKLPA